MTLCAVMLLFLLIDAFFQPPGVQRALALFLVAYCLVASFTEVGFTDVRRTCSTSPWRRR